MVSSLPLQLARIYFSRFSLVFQREFLLRSFAHLPFPFSGCWPNSALESSGFSTSVSNDDGSIHVSTAINTVTTINARSLVTEKDLESRGIGPSNNFELWVFLGLLESWDLFLICYTLVYALSTKATQSDSRSAGAATKQPVTPMVISITHGGQVVAGVVMASAPTDSVGSLVLSSKNLEKGLTINRLLQTRCWLPIWYPKYTSHNRFYHCWQ